MENEETENPNAQKIIAPTDQSSLSELDEQIWSVISFENRVGKNLTYREAAALLEKLSGEKVSGLCVITDEAAEKMSGE